MHDDRYWMHQALALAALGGCHAKPNPRVGCVLVKDGKLVGKGYHRRPGTLHADLKAKRGVILIALERISPDGERSIEVNPPSDQVVAAGDVLVVLAPHGTRR